MFSNLCGGLFNRQQLNILEKGNILFVPQCHMSRRAGVGAAKIHQPLHVEPRSEDWEIINCSAAQRPDKNRTRVSSSRIFSIFKY